jgi:hypothetical protein
VEENMKKKDYYLFAKEDVFDSNNNIIYLKDELVGNISLLNDFGKFLPRGMYYVKETNPQQYLVVEEKLESHTYYENVILLKQSIFIHLNVIDKITHKSMYGIHVGVFAYEDVYDSKHNIVYRKDDLIFDSNKNEFQVPLIHIDKGTFYIQQLEIIDGYVGSDVKMFQVDFTKGLTDFQITLENEPIIVEIKKYDENHHYLKGVWLAVFEENGNLVDEWISHQEHCLYGLSLLQTYVLKELKVPKGYRRCQDYYFTVSGYEKKQEIIIVNEKIE